MKKIFGTIIALALLAVLGRGVASLATSAGQDTVSLAQAPAMIEQSQAQQAIIVDHTCTDITAIPQEWIEEAKQTLHIGYGHTSHGSQLTSGMSGLVGFANGGGLGLSLPGDTFQFSHSGNEGGDYLHLFEGDGYGSGDLDHDCGYYPDWVDETRDYLGTPDPGTGRGTNNPDMNVIIWSWCGQVDSRDEQSMLDTYLLPMTQLEQDYPGVTFVYMTGHANGGGEDGNVHLRNQQIRNYCIENNKVLYDFYDIELYDPDGNYYGDKDVEDDCDYDSDGNGSVDSNWATEWQNSHTQDTDWYDCDCAHSKPLNCNQKAYATWWLWARLAGWQGGPQKTASPDTAIYGQTITYTVVVRDTGAPLTSTVYLTDEVPFGLAYVSGTITATAGAVNDDDAPTLRWSGVLTDSATPAVTLTYAVAVVATTPQTITNSAVIQAQGYPPITSTAMVTIVLPSDYPDLTPSYKVVSSPFVDYDERVTYTVGIRNDTGPLSETVFMTDTLPDGLLYVPGSLDATLGVTNTALLPVLRWSGVLSPTPAVTITYAVTVTRIGTGTASLPRTSVNTATIALAGYQPIVRTATLRVQWQSVYLPMVMKND